MSPNQIRKSPAWDDPRDWQWLPCGFAPGAVPPYNWIIDGDPIPAWFPELEDGVVLHHRDFFPGLGYSRGFYWDNGLPLAANVLIELTVGVQEDPGADLQPFPGPTAYFNIRIRQGLVLNFWNGLRELYYPDPYAVYTLDCFPSFGGPPDFISMRLTPVPYWYPEGPV